MIKEVIIHKVIRKFHRRRRKYYYVYYCNQALIPANNKKVVYLTKDNKDITCKNCKYNLRWLG